MSILTEQYEIEFPPDYDERAEYEAPLKGCLNDVVVRMGDGARYQLSFVDPVRMRQELMGEIGNPQDYFWQPNLVILPEVTTQAIRTAVDGLVKERFFQYLKPL